MRIFPITLGLLLASLSCTTAQVAVEVVLDQEQYLRDESLPVKVRITNRSGQTLHLGKDSNWLTFEVNSPDGAPIGRIGDPIVAGEFVLEGAQTVTRQVELMPFFELGQPARYSVSVTVRIPEWDREIPSKPKLFEIVRGTKLWEQEFGVPTVSGAPEGRKYVLQQAHYRKQLKLYVRVTDLNEERAFRVFPIGPLVSFSRPEAQLDKVSNLHVLFQTGARSFLYHTINPDGQILLRQTYDYADTRPALRASEEGKIFVAGGMRRITSSDILPPSDFSGRPAASATPTNAPGPISTNPNAKDSRK